MELRGVAISYGSFKKRSLNQNEANLIIQIDDIEENLNEINIDELEDLKAQLKQIREGKLKGHIIRAKAKWIDEGEKPSSFFCNLEKQNYLFIFKIIPKIEKENGEVITSQKDMLNETQNFYKTLYSSRDKQLLDVNLEKLLKNNAVRRLNNIDSQSIEGKITYTEAGKTLLNMTNDKTPGSDGFSANFFKMFWNDLGYFITRSINYGFDSGQLSIT